MASLQNGSVNVFPTDYYFSLSCCRSSTRIPLAYGCIVSGVGPVPWIFVEAASRLVHLAISRQKFSSRVSRGATQKRFGHPFFAPSESFQVWTFFLAAAGPRIRADRACRGIGRIPRSSEGPFFPPSKKRSDALRLLKKCR